jgi:AcrR family transcriptional regulator
MTDGSVIDRKGLKMAKSLQRRRRPGRPAAKRRPTASSARRPRRSRKADPAARRQAILDAALTVFAERGFEAARLDDIAARAGIAKGTLYLYFADKQALFEELIRTAVDPIFERLTAIEAVPDMPAAKVLEAIFSVFEKEVLGTKRKFLLRLLIAEGPRFPAIAEFHYRTVVARIMQVIRKIVRKAAERGEFPTDAAARFPQLVAAPLLVAVIWDSLFAKIEPLDTAGLFRAHREVLMGGTRRAAS